MRLLIAGDFVPITRTAKAIACGDYSCLENVLPYTKMADYSIVNYECPVVVKDGKPISKTGPNLKCTEKGIEAIQWAGFNCVTLANNHFYDYSEIGVRDTIHCLNFHKIDYVGGGFNYNEARRILYKQFNQQKLAVINCCENEFSIASDKRGGSNPINPISIYRSIIEARNNADFILVITHGGHEKYQLPSPRMQELYRFFVDVGADAVVNHHQHCFSGYEVYNGKPIFYGLGNFCFDIFKNGISETWHEGYMLSMDVSEVGGLSFEIIPYRQCREKPCIEILPKDAFNSKLIELNEIIKDEEKLNASFKGLCVKRAPSIIVNLFSPLSNKYLSGLAKRGLLPSFVSRRRLLMALNNIRCEAHRDILVSYLNDKISGNE